ncbi:N-6 DNA methylase, partial [Salmonella enterica]
DIDAGYLIGSIYTAMLPTAYRSDLGAYYTPPPLVSRLLDLAEEAGVDFSTASVIDPACGGGAFLAPVAMRMLQRSKHASSEWKLAQIGKRLKGVEIDPFAAWMTHVLLECV